MNHLDEHVMIEDVDPTPHEYGPIPDTMSLPRAALAKIPELEGLRARLADELFGVTVAPPRIGRFRLERKLGEGGMGQVFAAHDDALDRQVAVKVLHAERAETHGGRARMLREAQALARLSHPNVVQVFEAGEHEGQVYVAMEHVRGVDLGRWLTAEPRGWRAVLAAFIAAGHGLQAAHEAGLVHRDFKPANVIVGDDGRVRVLDFGLARGIVGDSDEPRGQASNHLDSPLSMTGALHGTPLYLAPEVLRGAHADARADQYAFCVALYEGLYAARPHPASTLGALTRAKLAGAVARPPADSRVPGWLHAALLRGLAVDPAQRWPSMRALLAELARDRVSAQRRRWAAVAGSVLFAAAGVAGVRSLQADAAAGQARAEAAELRAATTAREHALVLQARASEAQIRRALDLAGTPARAAEAASIGAAALQEALTAGAPTAGPLRALVTALAAPRLAFEVRAPGSLRAALFAADEQVIVTHGMDWTLRLWDATSGAQLAELAKIDAVRVAPDGQLVTVGVDGLVRRDPRSGAASRTYGPGKDVLELAPDGRLAAVRHADAIDVYDLERAVKVATLPVTADVAAFSADGAKIVTGRGGTAQLWSLPDGRQLGRLPTTIKGAFNFTNVAISPDGSRVAVTSNDDDLYLWDTRAKPRLIARAVGHTHAALVLRFAADGRSLLSAGIDGQIFLWHSDDARVLLRLHAEDAMWPRAALSPDGLHIAAADGQGVLRVWDARTGEPLARFSGDRGEFTDLQFSADGQRVLTTAMSGAASVWSFPRGVPARAEISATPSDAELHGDRVAMLGSDGAVALHDLSAAPRSVRLAGVDKARKYVKVGPDGASVLTMTRDGVAALYDARTGEPRCTIAGALRVGSRDSVGFTSADTLVGIADADRAVHTWSTTDCRDLATLSEPLRAGHIVAVTADALLLTRPEIIDAVPREDGLLETQKHPPMHTLLDPHGLVAPRQVDIGDNDIYRAGFSPDGAQVAITGREGLARVHDVRTGAALGELAGLSGWVVQVAYAPDGATLLTLGGGHAAHLWRASDRAQIARLELGDTPAQAAFSADGARLLIGDSRGEVGLWDARSGEFAGTIARLDVRAQVVAFSADDADALLVGQAHGAVRVPATVAGILAAGQVLLGE